MYRFNHDYKQGIIIGITATAFVTIIALVDILILKGIQ